MTKQADKPKSNEELESEIERLRRLLEEERYQYQEAKETLEAIRTGAVDGIVRNTNEGEQVFILKGSDQPYRNLIEEMSEGALLISESGTILYANVGFAGLVDAPLDKVIGTNVCDWVSVHNVEVLNDIISGNTKNGRTVFEIAFQTTKQKLIPTQVSLSKILFGTVNASALVVTDLTKHMEGEVKRYTANLEEEIAQRKKAEEKLVYSRLLLENISDAVIGTDPAFTITSWNNGAQATYGFTSKEAIGKQLGDVIETKYITGDAKQVRSQFLAEGVWRGEVIQKTKKGKELYIYSTVTLIKDNDGNTTAVVAINRDITERKKAEEKLKEYQQNLEKLVEERTKQLKDSERLAAIGATAGMVGHDIRNPLQAISSDVYLLKSELDSIPEGEAKENAAESLQGIEQNVDYINKIVQDLQDYARPLNPKIEETDLKAIIETFITKNGLPKNINVNLRISDEARKIRADSYYLNRILFNLVTNAIQAMPNGGKLTIEAHKEAKDTILAIKDTGVGIPKEIRDRMFTLMFTTKSKGQGFGLPVVKRMTESLGGTVTFESQEGKGTTFTVRLPPPPRVKR
jgi:PAS domain S-box-containing protein